DRAYQVGDEVKVALISLAKEDVYVYVLDCDAANKVRCLFPNREQPDNKVPPAFRVHIPEAGADYRVGLAPPPGTRLLKVVATSHPLRSLPREGLVETIVANLTVEQVREVFREVRERAAREKDWHWAEQHVEIVVRPAG